MSPPEGDTTEITAPPNNRTPADSLPASTRRSTLLGALVILAAVILAYAPAIGGGFIWDDDDYVTHNQNLRTWTGLGAIWLDLGATSQYYPLVHTSFWIEYRLWGPNPFGYHLVNVLLHALGAVLLWMVLRRVSLPGAWLAAAVFALHPVHVESVAWITERKNVLSGVFYLAAMLAYLRFDDLRNAGSAGCAARPATRLYALALALFVAALLSKTVTCSLPAAILLVIWWKRGRVTRPDVLPLLSFFLIGAIMALATSWMEKHHVGAEGLDWELTFLDRGLIAGRACWFYLAKIVWPAKLAFFYPRWRIDAGQWWQYLYPAAALTLLAVLWLARRRAGRGPLVAALFFGGTLLPALGFVDIYPMRFSFVADHFQYLASIGPIALLAALLTRVLGARPVGEPHHHTRPLTPWRVATMSVVLLGLASLTWRQGHNYRDVETLWRNTLAVNPSAWLAHYNLGEELRRKGDLDGALACVRRALKLKPDDYQIHHHLGNLLLAKGRTRLARKHLAKAVELLPEFPQGHYLLGVVLEALGDVEQANQHYDRAFPDFVRAAKVDPDALVPHLALADIYRRRGQPDLAIRHYLEATRLEPDNPLTREHLADTLTERGRSAEAIEQFGELLRLRPQNLDARCTLADLLRQLGRIEEAIQQYRQVLDTDPDHIEARRGLSATSEASGD